MSMGECWAQKMHKKICVVVTFLLFFFQAASKRMLTRLLEINTLLLECTQMGSLPSLPPCCALEFLEDTYVLPP